MKRVCVIGWPIGHSRSPLIHNYWMRKHGIAAVYEKHAVAPQDLADFIASFSSAGWTGCNVTIPHKETVCALLEHIDTEARTLGAVNTLYFDHGALYGTNTDGEGFVAHLLQSHPSFQISGANVIVYGAGGAAKAIIGTLLKEHAAAIYIINRTPEKITSFRTRFGPCIHACTPQAFQSCSLFINTTSLGMAGQPPLQVDLAKLGPNAIVADIVYVPLQTPLLREAAERGHPVLGGLGMLLHQAVRGFELWFGIRPEVTPELHDLLVADLVKSMP